MKSRIILGLGGTCFLVVFVLSTCVFLDGYALPYKPCRPLTYPRGEVTTDPLTITTTDSIESVFQFYDQRLKPKTSAMADMNEWSREHLNPSGDLYACYGVDTNGLTTETGCIYVSTDGTATKIEINLRRSEGGTVPCPKRGSN